MDEVFRALADPSRRQLLDSLQARGGQSLRELCAGLAMARQSVSKHLAVLEAANLVTTVRRGREALGITLSEPTTPARLLRRGDVSLEALERFLGEKFPVRLLDRDRRSVENRLRYGGYIERQERALRRLRREEGRPIPSGFDFTRIPGLSSEVVEKLTRIRPESLAQAARISGITPAALTLVNVYLEKVRRQGSLFT